ncbi:cell division protein ZapA [Maricaulis sp.]|uniref:cell division protein ZapA n=1 Tax=Maricaulis sp. TaxID=1486257 RepID=UPI00261B3D51|nr:cell division protein ZapA [Maricaulis sp.]
MSRVAVKLNGRDFTIGCEEGQEAYLRSLANYLDGKVGEISGQVGQIGDLRLLLMASLVVVDELREAERKVEMLEAHSERLKAEGETVAVGRNSERVRLAESISKAAERLEALAQTLEGGDDGVQAEPAEEGGLAQVQA